MSFLASQEHYPIEQASWFLIIFGIGVLIAVGIAWALEKRDQRKTGCKAGRHERRRVRG